MKLFKTKRKINLKMSLLICTLFCLSSISLLAENNLHNAGVVFYNQGKYEKALKYFSDAVKKDPDNIIAMYYFANTLVQTHNYGYAEKYYRRVIELDPYSDMADYSRRALNDITNYKSQIVQPYSSLLLKGQELYTSENSYIHDATKDKPIIRWGLITMPLRVYIDTPNYPENEKYAWESFQEWQGSSNKLVSFLRVLDEKDAHIVLKWKKSLKNVPGTDLHGYARPVVSNNELDLYRIFIEEIDENGDVFLSSVIKPAIKHQIGHSLGILNHSKNENDIMYIDGNDGTITRRDVSTLNLLYDLVPDISNFDETTMKQALLEQQDEEDSKDADKKESYKPPRTVMPQPAPKEEKPYVPSSGGRGSAVKDLN